MLKKKISKNLGFSSYKRKKSKKLQEENNDK